VQDYLGSYPKRNAPITQLLSGNDIRKEEDMKAPNVMSRQDPNAFGRHEWGQTGKFEIPAQVI
jgi:hypothetical protein